jgi:hypothetical protein
LEPTLIVLLCGASISEREVTLLFLRDEVPVLFELQAFR